MLWRCAIAFSLWLLVALTFASGRHEGWLTWDDAWVNNVVFSLALALGLGAVWHRSKDGDE